ncbi:unnamed protein product [Menidia menidia]|uniref:(Atlantic silverside) hypothetical protein n=1 Tax=Menidia menidia TaxID=238744 RepID=A0A8S4BFN4_9TELE|nr:unnamed protein product [Menidia menidia]
MTDLSPVSESHSLEVVQGLLNVHRPERNAFHSTEQSSWELKMEDRDTSAHRPEEEEEQEQKMPSLRAGGQKVRPSSSSVQARLHSYSSSLRKPRGLGRSLSSYLNHAARLGTHTVHQDGMGYNI